MAITNVNKSTYPLTILTNKKVRIISAKYKKHFNIKRYYYKLDAS